MPMITFEDLLQQADDTALRGDWQSTLATLEEAAAIRPDDVGVLTGLGTCVMQLERPSEAITYFQKASDLAPDLAEVHNNMGVAYNANDQPEAAEAAYRRAVRLDPDHVQAWKNLALLHLDQARYTEGVQILAAVVKAHPDDVEALFLMGGIYQEGEDYASARMMYQEVLKYEPDHEDALEALTSLPEPVPDPSRIARPEHAKKLAALKSLKVLKKRQEMGAPTPALTLPSDGGVARLEDKESIAFLGPADAATETRLGVPVRALADKGVKVKVGFQLDPADLNQYNVFVVANPHVNPPLCSAIERCLEAGKRVIVDIDQDFHHLPSDHPAHSQFGPGNSEALSALEAALSSAHVVTVPNAALAQRYGKYARRVEIIPHSWSRANALWEKPAPRRNTINLGLVSLHTPIKDAARLKTTLKRLLQEFPEAQLTIGGELPLYVAFSNIPEERRLYLPPGQIEDYPFLLANFDILLVPLRKNAFNRSRPDLPLLEAGIRHIPWVATPVSSFEEWEVGGLFVQKNSEWYETLEKLMKDAALREELGDAGKEKAEQREGGLLVDRWLEVLTTK